MISHLLNRTFNRWRHTTVSDGMGGSTTTWTQIGTVPGRLSSPSPAEQQAAAQEGVRVDYVLYLDANTDLARGERLVDGDVQVEVLTVTRPSVPGHHVKATVKQEPFDEPTQ